MIIRERRQTYEEFSEAAEHFAREHHISATLSARHVQRLASGHRADGKPLGPVRPSTRRLLETMLGRPIDELLATPNKPQRPPEPTDTESELRARLAAARTVDASLLAALRQQMDLSRIIDRKLGAPGLLPELAERTARIGQLLHHTLSPETRKQLAEILVDASTLAGWLTLDTGNVVGAWNYYNQAKTAALEAGSGDLHAYASAAQSAVLLDTGENAAALGLTEYALNRAEKTAPRTLRAWLHGAHGEACAANSLTAEAHDSFDRATRLIAHDDPATPLYLVFSEVHLSRWRGSAMTRLGQAEAADYLAHILERLDPSFTRAQIAIHTDLADIMIRSGGQSAAMPYTDRAFRLALQIGSVRQQRRIARLKAEGSPYH